MTSITPTGPQGLLDLVAEMDALEAGVGPTIQSDIGAKSGLTSANFAGVMVVDKTRNVPSPAYFGDVNVTANFNTDTMSGSASGFYFYDDSVGGTGRTASGTVTLSGNIIYGDGEGQLDSFPITVGGTLDGMTVTGNSVTGLLSGDDTTPDLGQSYETADTIDFVVGQGEVALQGAGNWWLTFIAD